MHQASELWFKAILHELDGLIDAFEAHEAESALWRMGRINALMRIVSAQLSALETLPPQHFAQFRSYLGTSSGSQSVQFRAIEAASGLRDEHFMQVLEEHGEIPDIVRARSRGRRCRSCSSSCSTRRSRARGALPRARARRSLFFLAEALLEYEQQFGAVAVQARAARRARARPADRRNRRHAGLAVPAAHDRPEVLSGAVGGPGQFLAA